ncbi:LCP family protein [Streptomyces sp. AK02-01A]|uniref:LCP family protein n=1 Tax=Streptomyces sp. AK02-01A TaxID=3028648 RepID=UPI0029B7CC98|nr:LCP family protein [Streptomyces sp. AK02-01A]MDX3850363.1 LCP family protein [Streptomyces sp. AK02-01A]
MDEQDRGRADSIDPADQWVLNPDTGEYELRLVPSAPQSPPPGARRSDSRESGHTPRDRTATLEREAGKTTGREIPLQRRQRAKPEQSAGRRSRRPAKKKSKAKKALIWTGGTMAFILVATGAAAYTYLKHLEGNVTTTDIGSAGKQGFSKDDAFNVLIIGTDKRTGRGNEGYGDKGSVGHADTNVLLHVSKDRTNATAMSIPRDLVVDIPDCPTKLADDTEKVIPGTEGARFNTSLGQDGRDPGCTMRTVEAVTGIPVDHFMMADFNAVKTLTSAVEGVDVCLEQPVNDADSHLKLPAGDSTIAGEQALAFLRTRHSWGNAGDLDRIKVQQQFLGSLMRKMASGDTLTSPTKLVSLAEAATKALTVDTGIGTVSSLKDVALELKKVPTKNISFMTVLVLDNPADGPIHKTVIVNPDLAPPVFDAIKNDVSFTEVKEPKEKKQEKDPEAALLKGAKSGASEVRVRVLNGGAENGSAQRTLEWLQNKKGVLKSENAGSLPDDRTQSGTTLEYGPDQASQARELAALMGLRGSAMKPGESVINAQGLAAMTLTLGKDFKGAGVSFSSPKTAPKVEGSSTANEVKCAS